jgi:hypothetical protein
MFKWVYFTISLFISTVYIGVSLYTIIREPLCMNKRHCNQTTNGIYDVLKISAISSTLCLCIFYCQAIATCVTHNKTINKITLNSALYSVIITYFHGIIVYIIHTMIINWRPDNDMISFYMYTYVFAFITSCFQVGWIIVLINLSEREELTQNKIDYSESNALKYVMI